MFLTWARSERGKHNSSSSRSKKRSCSKRQRTPPPWIEPLENRVLLSTWANPAGGDWDTASNWQGEVLPGPNDDVVINLPGNFTVTHSQNVTDTIRSLTIGSAGDSFVLSGGRLA